MTERLSCVFAPETDPYQNLALEEYLLRIVEPGECILYLWQNQKTVVIGRNQNAWKECRVAELEAAGGHLARRLSGGGAVFHDMGNLNFTFLANHEDYDVGKQTEVILEAVRAFGIPAEQTGRNDLTVDGRKFSGHAYYKTDTGCYHHGTLLIHADGEEMEKYLSVSREKLRAKGVDSVRSRVCNLGEYNAEVTVSAMRRALLVALSQVYALPFTPLDDARIDAEELRLLTERYASPAWKYGRRFPFKYEIGQRFSWGEVQVLLHVEDGCIADLAVYSDGLDTEYPALLRSALLGREFSAEAVKAAVETIPTVSKSSAEMCMDIEALLVNAM